MSTKSLLDLLDPLCPNWSRTNLRRLLQDGQDALFDYDAPYMHYLDTSNEGYPPYLVTVQGTERYEITAANLASGAITKTIGGTSRNVRCRQVCKVFVDVSLYNYDYDKRWLGHPYTYSPQNPYSNAKDRIEVADVLIHSVPALENDSAWIMFPEDPGSYSTQYFIDFLWEPPRLTADTIPLCVPLRFEEALFDYVLGRVQMASSGKKSDLLAEFEQKWIPQFQQIWATAGSQLNGNETQLRVC